MHVLDEALSADVGTSWVLMCAVVVFSMQLGFCFLEGVELMQTGQQLLGRRQVMPGVASLVSEVQVEGTFPDGTKLLTVHTPIVALDGDMELALQGSFLPAPALAAFGELDEDAPPGGTLPAEGLSPPGSPPVQPPTPREVRDAEAW